MYWIKSRTVSLMGSVASLMSSFAKEDGAIDQYVNWAIGIFVAAVLGIAAYTFGKGFFPNLFNSQGNAITGDFTPPAGA